MTREPKPPETRLTNGLPSTRPISIPRRRRAYREPSRRQSNPEAALRLHAQNRLRYRAEGRQASTPTGNPTTIGRCEYLIDRPIAAARDNAVNSCPPRASATASAVIRAASPGSHVTRTSIRWPSWRRAWTAVLTRAPLAALPCRMTRTLAMGSTSPSARARDRRRIYPVQEYPPAAARRRAPAPGGRDYRLR